jgi:MFS family permease
MYVPIWIINLVTAVIIGWGSSMLFVGSMTYVNACANEQNKGFYNAILWSGYTGTMITGNFIAAYVIPLMSQESYFLITLG